MGKYVLKLYREQELQLACDFCALVDLCKKDESTNLKETNQNIGELNDLTITCIGLDDSIIVYEES